MLPAEAAMRHCVHTLVIWVLSMHTFSPQGCDWGSGVSVHDSACPFPLQKRDGIGREV